MGYTFLALLFVSVRLFGPSMVHFTAFTRGGNDKHVGSRAGSLRVCSHYFVVKLQFIGCRVCVFEASAPSSGGGGTLCTGGSDSFFFPGFSFLSISGAGTSKRLKVKIFTNSERADCLFKQVRLKHR